MDTPIRRPPAPAHDHTPSRFDPTRCATCAARFRADDDRHDGDDHRDRDLLDSPADRRDVA